MTIATATATAKAAAAADVQPTMVPSEVPLERLKTLLDDVPGALGIEFLDGMIAALIAVPGVDTPRDWVPFMLGEPGIGMPDVPGADEILDLITRRWHELERLIAAGEAFMPALLQDPGGDPEGNEWASGYLSGYDTWDEHARDVLASDEESALCLLPAILLHTEHDRDRDPEIPEITPEKRPLTILMMVLGAIEAYRFFHSPDFAAAESMLALAEIHPDADCPCGSDKPYQRCCGLVN